MQLCVICMSVSDLIMLKNCDHSFCESCIHQWFTIHKHNTCPMCRCTVIPTSTTHISVHNKRKKQRHSFFSNDIQLSYLANLIGAL